LKSPKHSIRRIARNTTVTLVMTSTAITGTAGIANAGTSPTAKATAAATSITVWSAVGPDYSWQAKLVPAFEKASGIKVNYVQYPETSMLDKVQAAQEVHSNAYAVFEEPESQSSDYLALKGIAPIKSYLSSSSMTSSSYDFKGIPAGETAQCTVKGTLYCVPVDTDPGPEMFYNKAMFAKAGLKPPTTWAQVESDANTLTTGTQTGICMRGSESSPNGYPVLLMLPYFLPYSTQNKGEYLSPTWKPLFDTAGATKWANEYAQLMQKDAPKGVSAYDYTDCQHAFQTGATAMWWDDSSLANTLFEKSQDPQEYKNAGIDEIPCPTFNETCLLSAPWGMFINPNASTAQQEAGWQFEEYMTSPTVQITALNQSKDPAVGSRPTTLAYAVKHASRYGVPAQFLAAIGYSTQHIEPNAIPATAAFTAIQNVLFVILSELIVSQITPAQANQQLQSKMTQTLSTYHL
jgi:multiple sugar transport system substrate-binding protein